MPAIADRLASAAQSNFYYSFLFLPADQRRAIRDVYAFCRVLDDVVDTVVEGRDPFAELAEWRAEVEACYHGVPATRIGERLADAIERYEIPKQHLIDLIDGMEMDLNWQSYQTFSDLREYCYRAASTVGLICIEIFGYESPRTREYAVNLGLALQLTNVLRDLQEDVARGRIYLPLEDLERFGYTESDLKASRYNAPFVELMKFECARAESYFRRAAEALPEIDRRSLYAAETMGRIYGELLDQIREVRFDVFRQRVAVSKRRKLAIAFRTWLDTRWKG